MINIVWDQKFAVGHERIDHEHQVFLDLIKNASLAGEEETPKEKVVRLLNEVRKYAEFHFYSEENVMLDLAYPDYEEHKREHQALLAVLEDRVHDYKNDRVELDEIVEFLFDWFALHTTGTDKKLTRHINNP